MKTLILIRHAKSDWKNNELGDYERTLSKRGARDAPFMGEILKNKNINPDIVISSSAVRALTTAKIITDKIGFAEDDILLDRNFYSEGSNYITKIISMFDEDTKTLMLFGHNPDFTYMSTFFTGKQFSNVPTCGIVCIDFNIETWEEVLNVNGSLRFFEYPKLYK